MSDLNTLQECRNKIDSLDSQIIDLIKQRMSVSEQVAKCKAESGKAVHDPARERAILMKAADMAGDSFKNEILTIYTTLFGLSRARQYKLMNHDKSDMVREIEQALKESPEILPEMPSAACCGIEGAYAFHAAEKIFRNPQITGFKSFSAVANAVEKGLCQYGILPIENSSNGTVKQVYELMRENRFRIVRSVKLHIAHCLLAKPGTKTKDIREIITHEQAAGQCRRFIEKLGGITVRTGENTAAAARFVAESPRNDVAAIASQECAELYGLQVLDRNVQDHDNNYTRFICISRNMEILPGANRISLVLNLPHRSGELSRVIDRFAALGLNLLKLESQPIPGSDFEFCFYFDFEASVRSPEVRDLLNSLSTPAENTVFLGNYQEF